MNNRYLGFFARHSVILSVSLVILMVAMTCTGIAFAKVMANPDKVSYYLRGDVNMDGEVQAADARLALRGSIKLEDYAPGSPEFLRADYNGDGDLTASDARAILRVAIGLTPDHGQIFNPELDDYYTLHPDDPDKPTTPDEPTDPTEPDEPIISVDPGVNDPYYYLSTAKRPFDLDRVGLYYYNGIHVNYDDIPEGAPYVYFDEYGDQVFADKPYSSGNEPATEPVDLHHCKYCGKSTDDDVVNGRPACTIGGCTRWIIDVTCPYCGVFVPNHTCHTCGE